MRWMAASRLYCLKADRVLDQCHFEKHLKTVTLHVFKWLHCGNASHTRCAHGYSNFDREHIFCFWGIAAMWDQDWGTRMYLIYTNAGLKRCSSAHMNWCPQVRHGIMCQKRFQLLQVTVLQKYQSCFGEELRPNLPFNSVWNFLKCVSESAPTVISNYVGSKPIK